MKQIDPNDEDRRVSQAVDEDRTTGGFRRPGATRVRQEIIDAMPQLKLAKGRAPTILVLYDNTCSLDGVLHNYDVLTGLYGVETSVIGIPADASEPPFQLAHKFGKGRRVSPTANTTLSAVLVLNVARDRSLTANVFHNCFAAMPLDAGLLRSPSIRHFMIEPAAGDPFAEWREIYE